MKNFLQVNRALAAKKNFRLVNRALAAKKNFRLVNRALAAEKNFYFNNLISLADVMSRSSRRTDNLLSNKDATRQKDGKKTATTRQRCTMSNQGLFKKIAMIFAVLTLSIANIGMAWGGVTVFTSVSQETTDGSWTLYGSSASASSQSSVVFPNPAAETGFPTGSQSKTNYYNKISSSGDLGAKLTDAKCVKIAGLSAGDQIKVYWFATNNDATTLTLSYATSSSAGAKIEDKATASVTSKQVYSTTFTALSSSDITHITSAYAGSAGYAYISSNNSVYIYAVKITAAGSGWGIAGSMNKWTAATNEMTGSGTVSTTISLSANTQYEFKVVDISSDAWYGNGGTIKGGITDWLFETSKGNTYLRTSCAGDYTFTFNTSTKNLSITYPESHKVFFNKDGASWSKIYAYCYNDGDWNIGWPGIEITSNTEDHCGTEYYAYTNGYTYIIFNNGSGGVGNQTGNITVAGYEGKHAVGAAATGWTAYPTYTVTYNANGDGAGNATGTTGSVPTDSNSPYACSSTVTVLGNTGSLVKTCYNFTGWNTAPNGSGAGYTAGNTFTISANTTLYAQWEAAKYTVTYDVNGGGSVTPTSATQASSGASVTLPTPTWSGYTFDGWYSAGAKIGNGGASYTPTADITLYAHWTDNISGKLFSYVDGHYGDKCKAFDLSDWVSSDQGGSKDKTYTNGTTGIELNIDDGGWDNKSATTSIVAPMIKFIGTSTTKMSVTIPSGKHATITILYGSYSKNDKYLKLGDDALTKPSSNMSDPVASTSGFATVTLTDKTGTVNGFTTNSGNVYIAKVSATITGYTVSYAAGTYGSGSLASGTKTAGSSFTLSSSDDSFTRDGYVYDGWSTNADGSTKDYNLGGSYTTDAPITLYPHWVAACTTPAAPTNFTAGSISATGATFTITDAADAASYDIYYSTSSTAPTSGTDATTTSTSKTKEVTGLTAATTYYAWVRSVCDASHKSAWVALNPGGDTHTFATSCVAPTTVNVTATVNEVSGFWFYPDDDVVLTAAPTGTPAGSPVTYQWKKNGADIDGATSSTYTIDEAAASDAGKYTCTISYGACSTTSAEFELKCMQFYLKNSGGSDISNHALTKVDATHATLSLSLTGGTTYKFRVTDGCNNWYGNSDETGMTSSNCSNWTMPHDADCKVTTSSKSATYTFNFDFSAGLLGSEMKVSVVYPAGDQAAGKVIYWDNSVLNWASAPWYRIGKGTHNNKTQMTLVPGTANLYKITTAEYNGFEYWHIANNEGEGTGNIFWTKDSDPATNEAITAAMGFEGSPVTADAVTFTPTSSHATGSSSENDNCEFYEYGRQNGMKTDRVTISPYSNGTITVNYVDTDEEAASFTSGYADLAHTVKLTSITAVPNTGYDAGAITINDDAYETNYVVTANTTIAASFTPHVYSITYLDKGGSAFSGSHADGYPTTHTYATATTLKTASKTGYTFDGWYGNSACTGSPMTSIGATSITADITLYAKWTVNSHTLTWNLAGGTVTTTGTQASEGATGSPSGSVNYGTTVTAPVVTKAGYTFNAWSPTVVSPMPDEDKTYTATWTAIVPSSVTLNKTSTSITVGGTETLTATISPAVVADNTITWTSSDETVATVTSAGVVTGVKAGTATITATTVNGKTATCEVTVAPAVTYTVTYEYNGATGGDDTPSATGASVTLPEPTKTGYELDGWYTTAGEKIEAGSETYNPTADITLYARWTETCSGGGGGSTTWEGTPSSYTNGSFTVDNKLIIEADPNDASKTAIGSARISSNPTNIDKTCITINSTDKYITGYMNDASEITSLTIGASTNQGDKSGTYVVLFSPNSSFSSGISVQTYTAPAVGAAYDEDVLIHEFTPESGTGTKYFRIYRKINQGVEVGDYTSPSGGIGSGQTIRIFQISVDAGGSSSACHKVLYHGNGATSGYIYDPNVYDDDDDPTVLGNVAANGVPFVKAGQTFQGWAEGSDHAAAGTVDYTAASIAAGTASITDIDGDVDLYAVWSSCTAPTTAFANGSYTIGGSALDLSTLISSKQGDGTITYAVTDANGTGASIAGGTSFTATIAGTATVTATQAADGGYCEKVMDATITVIDPATPIITWTLAVGSTTWACTPHTEDETNITSVSHSAPSGTIDTGNGTGDRTAKINIDSDVADLLNNPTNYITFTFNVACNKKLTPDSVVMKVANVGGSSGNNETYKAVLSDNYGHGISAALCPTEDGKLFKLQIDNEDEVYFQGDVTLKVWAWNTKSSNKATAFRFGNLVKIVGTIANQATPTATITWTKQPAGGLSGTNETVLAVSSDGSAVTITSNNGSVATVAGSTVSYVGVGSTYLTASGTDACGNTMVSVNSDNFTVIGAYNLSYDKNGGGAGTMNADEIGVHYAVVAENEFTAPDGKTFYGWNTAANGSGDSYQPGDAIELSANTTLYAQWGTELTATWSVTKVDSKLYRGGGGYSVTVYLDDADWDAIGNKDDLDLTATEGVTLKNIVKSINGDGKAQVTADFDITTGVDADATSITFTLFVPAAGTYASAELTDDKDLDECSGGSGSTISIFDGTTAIEKTDVDGTSYKEGVEHTDPQTGFKYTCKGVKKDLYTTSMSNSTGNGKTYSAGLRMGGNSSSSDYYIQLKVPTGYTANLYIVSGGGGGGSTLGVSKTAGTSTSYHEYANRTISSSGSYYLDEVTNLAAGTYYILGSSDKLVFGEITVTLIPAAGEGGVATTLSWTPALESDAAWNSTESRLDKETGDADFTFTATQDKNSLGAITYSSNNTAVATVNATTGKVHIVGAAGEATITATLAASGCFEEATATYTINVVDNCIDEPGTITSRDLGCEGTEMTVSGHTELTGVRYQWYKVGSPDEAISGATSATYTATAAGEYYVIVTNSGTGHCPMASTNTVTVTAKAAATATKIVNSWYVKNGRRTPDVALVQSENAESFTVKSGSTTIWESAGSTKTGFGGCGFHMDENGIIYLNGTTAADGSGNAPSGLTGGEDETLTITVNGCGGSPVELNITIHKQESTTRKSVAFVVDGTKDGAFDADNESHSVNTALYKYLDNTASGGTGAFDLTAQNIYATTNEKAIREHYSQFDAILITDDPGTKETPSGDYKTKGYVNAFGTMVDVRPILTMEAYVSALANWKTKGIAGEPTSPNPRQYALRLECKDHEIYKEGLPNPAPGTHVWDEVIDGQTYRNVVLVDHTKSPYTDLADDEKTKGNESPALQGFDGTASGSLLGLGRISNGSLQAAIERQEEPAARLLVFSIQAKALPNALTEEGKIVIKNILTYLLKTNMEEVDDCSNYFTGKFDDDWSNADNWSKTELPSSEAKVRILAECEIGEGTQVHVSQVDIVTSGTSSKLGGGTANGRLTISAGGSLIVGGKIRKAEAPHFGADDLMPMDDPSKLIINTDGSAQAALIFDNDDADTKATVNLYSLGRKQSSYQYQYFAVPMEVVPVNPTFANETHGGTGIYTYVYNEATSGWERRRYYDDLFAFEGLGITTKSTDPMNYTMTGNIASTATKEITLTHDGAGLNLIGNSWMAPIQIGALAEDNAGLDNQTVYIYCAGRDAEGGAVVSSDDTETPGQWLAVPFEAASFPTWKDAGKLSVIPAMQAFQIKVDAEATLTLDYDKVVRGSTNDLNAKLRAPGRRMAANEVTMTNIRVADSKTHTDLSLFEGDRFSEAFDNGWEAEYMNGDGRSAKLYAETEAGQMAVAAMYDYEGTVVGFAPGQETEYTFSFMGEDNGYYLNDIKLQNSVRISEGETYTFTYEEGDAANRFYISRTAINAPEVPTGMENLDAAPRVQKIIYNDKLYIIRGGRLYDATGKVVK